MCYRWRVALLVSLGLACAACGPRIREARFRTYPPRDASHEILVYQTTRPECSFEEVGTITVEKRNAFVSSQEMLDSLRERARRMGGDALLGLAEGNRVAGAAPVGAAIAVANRQTFSSTVIRFADDSCRKDAEQSAAFETPFQIDPAGMR